MASRMANEAVELYRKLSKLDRRRARMETELQGRVADLDEVSFRAYMKMTSDIDKAIDTAEESALNEQAFTAMVNHAGTDSG